jgi:hypothetical protein
VSDLEPPRDTPPDRRATTSAPSPEPWSAGWSWTVRLLGAAIMAHQAFFETEDRQWLLLCAMGMMLGELGLKALLRFLLRTGGGE